MRIILILLTCIFVNSCGLDQEEKNTALKLIDKIDSVGIENFESWDYSFLGFGVRTFYRHDNVGNTIYSCRWRDDKDSIELLITSLIPFNKDFGIIYLPDKQYDAYKFRKYSDSIKLFGLGQNGLYQAIKLIDTSNYKKYFSISNPFDFFKNQFDFYDNCGILKIFKNDRYGGFIQFKLNNGYILSYLPTDIDKNEKYIQDWNTEMEKGEMIRKNWNYRKIK